MQPSVAVGADSISARSVFRQRKIQRANNVRPYSHRMVVCRGRRCGVAQRSMPQWGIEPHERASFAGWRPSFWPPSADAPGGYAWLRMIARADMESAPTINHKFCNNARLRVGGDACIAPQSLPCVKGDSPQCGEMSRSDRGARRVSGCPAGAEGLWPYEGSSMYGQGHNPSVCAIAQPAPFTQGGLWAAVINLNLGPGGVNRRRSKKR